MTARLFLKKNEHRRILAGHQWVFSNEIGEREGSPEAGDLVSVLSQNRTFLGVGFYNPRSLIAIRMLGNEKLNPDLEFFRNRIAAAARLRERLYPGSTLYRLVHGESDYLPGLIIDRYDSLFAVQTLSAGMDRRMDIICDAIETLFSPSGIVERNDSALRALEGLNESKRVVRGTTGIIQIRDHDLTYETDLLEGQKTGLFLDQRENHRALRRYVKGMKVLDVFCNAGGFALNALAGGAAFATAVDDSETALEMFRRHLELNNFSQSSVEIVKGDAFKVLDSFRAEGRQFDVIIVDPPSFAPNKKSLPAAMRAYVEINSVAMRLLPSEGILVSASCSHHVESDNFVSMLQHAATSSGRKASLLELRGASADHPVLASMPETKYLKCAFLAVTK